MIEDKYDVKKDCFAYKTKEGHPMCNALNELYCKQEKCRFFKTREEYIKPNKK